MIDLPQSGAPAWGVIVDLVVEVNRLLGENSILSERIEGLLARVKVNERDITELENRVDIFADRVTDCEDAIRYIERHK